MWPHWINAPFLPSTINLCLVTGQSNTYGWAYGLGAARDPGFNHKNLSAECTLKQHFVHHIAIICIKINNYSYLTYKQPFKKQLTLSCVPCDLDTVLWDTLVRDGATSTTKWTRVSRNTANLDVSDDARLSQLYSLLALTYNPHLWLMSVASLGCFWNGTVHSLSFSWRVFSCSESLDSNGITTQDN